MQAIKFSMLGIIGMIGLLISAFGPFKVPFAETLAKTYYRHAIVGLVLVVALVGGLIAAVVNLFDPNQFKDQIVRWVHERTQRDLVLEGELKMSYFPKLGLESGKAALSQRRSAREFASIERARVTIAWWPLLSRRVHIDSIEVDGLRTQLVRFKDGSTNVDDLAGDLLAMTPASIDVDSLRLSRASVQWNDEIEFQRGSVHELQIDLGRLADGLASPLSASARVDAPYAGIDARLQLKGRLLFDATAGRVELARIESVLEGKAFGFDNLALNIGGDVTALPSQRALNADNVVVTSISKSGLSVHSARLAVPELKFSAYRLSGTALSIDASTAHPDRTVALALQLPRFEWAERALRDTTAHAQLTLRSAGTQAQAKLSSPMALHLEAGPRLEFSALELSATASHPALAAELATSLSGTLELNLRQQGARAVLSGKLAGSDVRGEIRLADFSRPRWSVELDAARLDLDALLSPAWLARWGDDATPFDAAALRDATAQGRVRVAQVKLGGLQLSEASARFELERSALRIEPIAAQAYGAELDATLVVDASEVPRVTAKGALSELDMRSLLSDVTRAPRLEGRAALAWDLVTDGASVGSLRNRLAGTLNLAMRGGALSGIDLRAALLDGRAELGRRLPARQREFNPAASTPFSELTARLELREGRASGQTLELNAAPVRIAGEGTLLLASGELDLRLQATVGRGTLEWTALAGTTVPVQMRGPWREPRFALDFGAATGSNVPRSPEAAAELPVAMGHGALPSAPAERLPLALSAR